MTFETEYKDLEAAALKGFEEKYGKNAPDMISFRLKTELEIIKEQNSEEQNSAISFMLAREIVQKSHEMGYPAGERGCIGSSFAAFLLGITEINPLMPHYICPKCKHTELAENIYCGYDLKEKPCPVCGAPLKGDGVSIPFETFFGKAGERFVDININVAPGIHKDMGKLVKEYAKALSRAGYGVIITEDKNLVKLEFKTPAPVTFCLLTHPALGLLRELETLTGVKISSLPFDDGKTLRLFKTGDIRDISGDEYKIYEAQSPGCFADIIRCSGLAHGTGTWIDNGCLLLKAGHKLNEIISSRDDVMLYLLKYGFERGEAFLLSDRVRKGKGLTAAQAEDMQKHGVPQWFIESCNKIKYLFPRAHCAAYSLLNYRLAYFKANFESEYDGVTTGERPGVYEGK